MDPLLFRRRRLGELASEEGGGRDTLAWSGELGEFSAVGLDLLPYGSGPGARVRLCVRIQLCFFTVEAPPNVLKLLSSSGKLLERWARPAAICRWWP